jgi:membrane protein implicated in regulation of membrane protease activity
MFWKLFNQSSSLASYFQGEATVTETIYPHHRGRVYFKATWWFARCQDEIVIEVNQTVNVIERVDLTLIVTPTSY